MSFHRGIMKPPTYTHLQQQRDERCLSVGGVTIALGRTPFDGDDDDDSPDLAPAACLALYSSVAQASAPAGAHLKLASSPSFRGEEL
ncbi:hypothetical protein GOP47_0025864 [Adiantum capillus-veneris]|uniref:Uncharacterized protein n=1 Tax=Adiantum capillus-veneris TaxID=13818 RepID=A0A9D4Z394_ADICA|nr:hypothetical protein GOP47_0025864 [Adiantum capillus-veneris]